MERFGAETVPCRFCGTEIYDEAEWCHKCGKSLGGDDEPARGVPVWFLVTSVAVVGVILLLALRLV